MSKIEENYKILSLKIQQIQEESHRDLPVLIAVSKSQPVAAIQKLYDLGHRDFGENYAQELVLKDQHFREQGIHDIRWHFIGHLQSNKVKLVLPRVASIHTLSSLSLAQELSKRIRDFFPEKMKMPVFVEVNLHQEESKSGLSPDEVLQSVEKFSRFPELSLQGLMCVPNPEKNSRDAFLSLKSLEEMCRPLTRGKLSMGMSSDFEDALMCGATHIRLGTILFGKR